MKTKNLLTIAVAFSTSLASAQGLLNKVKSKAAQEINKLEQNTASKTSSSPTGNKLSSNVTRTVAVNLKQGESFDYSESCIDLGASINQISFIVNSGFGDKKQCFAYKNGTRTPVACPNSTDCGSSLQCSYNKITPDRSGNRRSKEIYR